MLEYKGLPVPWVAAWDREVPTPSEHPMQLVDGWVRYNQERVQDRDQQGALWLRNSLARGQDVPMFGQVHALRQRACMVHPRCQVCGLRMKQHTFLLHEGMMHERTDKFLTTATPPVCEDCRDLAMHKCPHLVGVTQTHGDLLWITSTDVGVWGYLGDLAHEDGHWTRGQYVNVQSEHLRRLLVKQLVIGMREWTEVPYALVAR